MKFILIQLICLLGVNCFILAPALAQTNLPPGQDQQISGNQPADNPSSSDQMAELAKELNNPVAALINVPFQNNFDFGGGPANHGFQYKSNFQPVIPFVLNDHWNLITRTIIPYIYQNDRIGTSSQSGLGDSSLSLFFSPKSGGPGGMIWGMTGRIINGLCR
jgi:hypothetical protein